MKAERQGASHLFHLVMSLITFGFWLIVWLYVAITREYRCAACGSAVKTYKPRYDITDPEERRSAYDRDVTIILGAIVLVVVLGLVFAFQTDLDKPEFSAYEVTVPRATFHVAPNAESESIGFATEGAFFDEPIRQSKEWIRFNLESKDGSKTQGWIQKDSVRGAVP